MLVKFTSSGYSDITNDGIYGGVSYILEVNNDDNDLHIGTDACAEIKFITDKLTSSSIGRELTYFKRKTTLDSWTKVGIFKIVYAEKSTGGKFLITAYDNIYKFNVVIDSWWNNLFPTPQDPSQEPSPQRLYTVYSSLCTYCGVTYEATNFSNFINRNYYVRYNFAPQNVTGRTMLSYIADIAGGYACADADGKIMLRGYTTNSTTLTRDNYSKLTYSDFTVPVITGVSALLDDRDTPVILPSGALGNLLRITGNPLLVWRDDTTIQAELNTALNNIYNALRYITYVPTEILLFEDYGINAGDKIRVTYGNTTIDTLVMLKEVTKSGVKFTCCGLPTRSILTAYTAENIEMLRGYYSRVKKEVNYISAEVGNLQTKVSTTVKLQADRVTITDLDDNVVTITGTCVDAATLNASLINSENLNLTGRIAFGDLDTAVGTLLNTRIPSNITSTYIDFSEVQTPYIKTNNLLLRGGIFELTDNSGVSPYGYMGLGEGPEASESRVDPGVILCAEGKTATAASNYILVTSSGVMLNTTNCNLRLNSTGGWYTDNSGTWKLGPARFG